MTRSSAIAAAAAAALTLTATACGAGSTTPSLHAAGVTTSASGASGVPSEFRHACGHPHAVVRLRALPVDVSGARCDLTGVTVVFHGVRAQVQPRGHGMGVAADGATESHELQVTSDRNGDVHITGD